MRGSGYSTNFLIAKTLDLGLISFYYFALAIVFSILLNLLTRIYERLTNADAEKSTARLGFEIVGNIFFIVVTFWVIRNAVEYIPFPLDGLGGYKHSRLSQTTTSAIAGVTLLIFQTALADKIREFNSRVFEKTWVSRIVKI